MWIWIWIKGLWPRREALCEETAQRYFERQGKVQGDLAVDLFFKAAEMSDVLKSLTVLDLGGGIVSNISSTTRSSIR